MRTQDRFSSRRFFFGERGRESRESGRQLNLYDPKVGRCVRDLCPSANRKISSENLEGG